MAIDIRATVTCSLGTLISGSISDDYLQGSGLIKTRGSVEISGTITPAIGTVVTFSYVKGGVTRSIPRKLRVLSSFADPFRRTTKVELGCKLTYLSDLKDPIKWDAFDDPENDEATEEEDRIITIPINASSVMAECLTKLGISSSGAALTNKFSVAEFDFSPGYVQVLNDLLVSECYFGYLDTNEVLQIRSLNAYGGTGPVFTSADIVDLGPIGVGQLPGEAVTVSYSTLKLTGGEACEEDDDDTLNWEKDETIGVPTTVRVDNPFFANNPFPYPVPQFFTYTYTPRSVTITEYDDLDRVTTRTTTEYTILADIAASYIYQIAGTAPSSGPSIGSAVYTIVTTERTTYKVSADNANRKEPPEGYEEIEQQERIVEEPLVKLYASLTIYDAVAANNESFMVGYRSNNSDKFVAEKVVTRYDYGTSVEGAQISKTLNDKYLCYGYTQEGQQSTATWVQQSSGGEDWDDYVPGVLQRAEALTYLGTEIALSTGRELNLQQRPSSADRTNKNLADGGDPNNGFRTESKGELELAVGSATAQRRIELSMPYAPDDRFIKISEDPLCYRSTPSDAPQKAAAFGRAQNRLLLGNRNGMNLQLSPERLPTAPFDPLYVQASGLTAIYRANGTSWAFDSNGIVASVDALFWGAVGGTGTFWFPVAPGITTLPAEPPIVDGEMNASTVVLPYNETVVYDSRIRLLTSVTKFAYSLELLTEVDLPLVPVAVIDRFLSPGIVPDSDITVEAFAPVVTSSVDVRPPASDMTMEAPVPLVGRLIGIYVEVPATDVAVAASVPVVAPALAIRAGADVTVTGEVPTLSGP